MGKIHMKIKMVTNYIIGNHLILLVPLARVERAAHGLGIRCSILLSYRGSHFFIGVAAI